MKNYKGNKHKRKMQRLLELDADLASIDYTEKSNKETALEKIMATHIAEEQRYIRVQAYNDYLS